MTEKQLKNNSEIEGRNRAKTLLFSSIYQSVQNVLKEVGEKELAENKKNSIQKNYKQNIQNKIQKIEQKSQKNTTNKTLQSSDFKTGPNQKPCSQATQPANPNASPRKQSKFNSEFLSNTIQPPRPRLVNIGGYILDLDKVLGKGSYATVYLGQRLSRLYAIKRILKSRLPDKSRVQRLIVKEKEILRNINHPNILKIHEFLETTSSYFIIAQYCPDGDLGELITKQGHLSEAKALDFLAQIMEGFKELQKHKVMHRDFKPDNVFLDGSRAIIGDFGFAKAGVDVATTVLGTPYFIAPEVLGQGGPVAIYGNKVDLWSIGVSFYQMLFGNLPWDTSLTNGRITVELLTNSSGKNLRIPKNKTCSPGSLNLLRRLLDPDPITRIDWEAFFSHPVFACLPNKISPISLKKEKKKLYFRRNTCEEEISTSIENDSNMAIKSTPSKHDLIKSNLPQLLNPEEEHRKTCSKREKEKRDRANAMLIMKKCIDRLRYEIHLFQFLANTALDLLDLAAVQGLISPFPYLFSQSALLLLKLAIMLNMRALLSLERGDNLFELEGFGFFRGTEYSAKMISYLGNYLINNQTSLRQALQNQHGENKVKSLCNAVRPQVELIPAFLEELAREIDNELKKWEMKKETQKELVEDLVPSHLFRSIRSMTAQMLICLNYKLEFEYVYEVANTRWQNIQNKLMTEEYVKITIDCYRMEQKGKI